MVSPLDEALSRLSEEHREALRWLSAREGESRKRPWSSQVASDPHAPKVKLTAERGIHVPAGWDMALSVALTRGSHYHDGDLEMQPDGTWILLLRAHEGRDGFGLESRWNRGLYNCLVRRVPVAVFMPANGSDYRWLGLAFVDHYDLLTQTFLLHGPVRDASTVDDWGTVEPLAAEMAPPDWFVDESDPAEWADQRLVRPAVAVVRENQQRFRQLLLDAYAGRCAITRYDSSVTLDAAHILPFLGRPSDTARNGLLLRADIHRLFDRHLLSVDTGQMTVVVSPRLESTRYSDLEGTPVTPPADKRLLPSLRHLELHKERFDRAASMA